MASLHPAFVLAVILSLPGTGLALHRDSPAAARVTQGAGATIPRTRGWRTWLPLTSTEDLTGGGRSGQQVFLFDLWTYDCVTKPNGIVRAACPAIPSRYLTRVTDGAGSPDHPTVNGVGRMIAFDADGSYGGGTGPGAQRRQIFVLDRRPGTLARVTSAADGDSIGPSLDDGGRRVVFQSTAALLGGPSGVSQIFIYDIAAHALQQITHGAAGSHDPMLDKTGKRIVFTSTADLLGDGRDTGIAQVFWASHPFDQLHQLTRGNGPSRHPYVAVLKPSSKLRTLLGIPVVPGGHSVVFESEATDLPGARATPGSQIFFGQLGATDLPPVVQVTPPPVDGCGAPIGANASEPTADPAGRAIFFTSSADLLCNGTSGRRLFRFTIAGRPGLSQLTAAGDVAGPAVPLDGWCVAVASSEDISGAGVCGQQVHVLDFFSGMWREATVAGERPDERPAGSPAASCDDTLACTADACAPGGCVHTPIPGCVP